MNDEHPNPPQPPATPPPHEAGTIPEPSTPTLSTGLDAPTATDPETGQPTQPRAQDGAGHRPVRHHPETGFPAVHFPAQIDGSGARWLYVHTDHRGDVVAKALADDDVADWTPLTPDTDN